MRWSALQPLRIAVLDDHALIRDALKIRLSLEADFKITGVYTKGRDLNEGLQSQPADVLILDYQLADGELDGLRLIRSICSQHPDLRIVIYSSVEIPATINMCIQAGAIGFVSKSQKTEDLLHAIRAAALDRIYLAPTIAAEIEKLSAAPLTESNPDASDYQAPVEVPKLSPKEREVLRCCLEGMSVSLVALKFSRSCKTISGQKRAAFRKLGIQTDSELFRLRSQLKEL